ncbi:MAG: hypothetical protein ACOVNU_00410 [Candidatus Kapaibacteriota bacterium]
MNEVKELEMFINKVNRKDGWIDYIDAFRLIDIYTKNYGVLTTRLSIEDELIIMWDKVKKIKVIDGEIQRIAPKTKKCFSCGIIFNLEYFTKDKASKDGFDYKCRDCKCKYSLKYKKGKK